MKFKVPKFLERETKILTFLTFKQLALVGLAGLLIFILYYILPRGWFFIVAVIIGGITFSLLIIRVEGIPIGQLVIQSFTFLLGSKKFEYTGKMTTIWAIKLPESRDIRFVKQ